MQVSAKTALMPRHHRWRGNPAQTVASPIASHGCVDLAKCRDQLGQGVYLECTGQLGGLMKFALAIVHVRDLINALSIYS